MIEKLVTLKYPYLDMNMEKIIESELNKFLSSINKKSIFNALNYVIKEMAANANKANLKRVHFDINELDIGSMDDYEKGTKSFRDDLNKNYSKYSLIVERLGYYVRLDFLLSKGYLVFLISNNNPIIPIEKKRFLEKLKRSTTIGKNKIEDLLNIEDNAGLGIFLSVMLLKAIGLDEKSINLVDDKKNTQFKVVIPLSVIDKKEVDFISNEIIKKIDDIPRFPRHILDIQSLLINEDANFITRSIQKDNSISKIMRYQK